jgi:hypothetical protein
MNCKQISSMRFLEEEEAVFQKYPCYQKSCDGDLFADALLR